MSTVGLHRCVSRLGGDGGGRQEAIAIDNAEGGRDIVLVAESADDATKEARWRCDCANFAGKAERGLGVTR